MSTLASILVALVAIEHIYILWIEMFAWTTKGKEVFKGALPDELFERTQGLAANQGLYNGFLAAGLLWGLFITILVAALYGAWRSSKSILFQQGLPAFLALLLVLLSVYY